MAVYLVLSLAVAALWVVKYVVDWLAAVNALRYVCLAPHAFSRLSRSLRVPQPCRLVVSIRNYPGLRYAFGPDSLAVAPRIPYVSAGYFSVFTRKHRDFEEFDSDIVSSVRGIANGLVRDSAHCCDPGVMAPHARACPYARRRHGNQGMRSRP